MLGTPKRDRTRERREATRREILDAAWDLAREVGIAGITLRDIARRVGMQAPSLYGHFASKHAIYDAMFGQAWSEYERVAEKDLAQLPDDPRSAVRTMSRTFFDFAVADLPRYQLMNQRTIPGFEPSPASYALAQEAYARGFAPLEALVELRQDDRDLITAIAAGLLGQQLANDAGGTRWVRLIDDVVDLLVPRLEARSRPPAPSGDRSGEETAS